MKQRTSHILFNYWNEIRGTRLAPRRFEIEPSRISKILAETFILERANSRTYSFRLAGTRMCEQFGLEFRGRNFLEFAGENDRSQLELDFASIGAGAVGIFEIEACDRQKRKARFEAVVMPLIHGRQDVTRFVGAISPEDAPSWLGFEPLQPLSITDRQLLWPDGRPHAVLERNNRQAPFIAELANARIVRFNRQHFRVLDGGRQDGTVDKPAE